MSDASAAILDTEGINFDVDWTALGKKVIGKDRAELDAGVKQDISHEPNPLIGKIQYTADIRREAMRIVRKEIKKLEKQVSAKETQEGLISALHSTYQTKQQAIQVAGSKVSRYQNFLYSEKVSKGINFVAAKVMAKKEAKQDELTDARQRFTAIQAGTHNPNPTPPPAPEESPQLGEKNAVSGNGTTIKDMQSELEGQKVVLAEKETNARDRLAQAKEELAANQKLIDLRPELSAEIAELQTELNNLEPAHAKLSAEVSQEAKDIETLSTTIENSNGSVESLTANIPERIAEVMKAAANKEISEMGQELSTLRETHQPKSEQLEADGNRILDVRTDLQSKRTELDKIDAARANVPTLEAAVASAQANLETVLDQNAIEAAEIDAIMDDALALIQTRMAERQNVEPTVEQVAQQSANQPTTQMENPVTQQSVAQPQITQPIQPTKVASEPDKPYLGQVAAPPPYVQAGDQSRPSQTATFTEEHSQDVQSQTTAPIPNSTFAPEPTPETNEIDYGPMPMTIGPDGKPAPMGIPSSTPSESLQTGVVASGRSGRG